MVSPSTLRAVALVVAALGSGLSSGVLFAFSTFVMPALARLPPTDAAAAMRAINVAAINVPFMTVLFGSGVVAAGLGVTSPTRTTVAGAVLYIAGVLAVTAFANVPRNEALAASDAYWPTYLHGWCVWNHVRATAGVLATTCFLSALVDGSPSPGRADGASGTRAEAVCDQVPDDADARNVPERAVRDQVQLVRR